MNGITERAERGQLIFNGESWQMLPDQEHDVFGLLRLEPALAALRPEGSARPTLAPVVRVGMEAGQQEKHYVKQLLDAGLMGLILPQIETAEQLREFIAAMRYPPQQRGRWYGGEPAGKRGWSPGRAAQFWGVSTEEYARKADVWPLNAEGELLAMILIETKQAVDNIAELLEVPGLGVVLVGMGDLSMSLGLGTPAANQNHPDVMAAVDRVAQACAAHRSSGGKVICGRYQTAEGLEAAIAKGFTMFTSQRGDYRGDLMR
ncbi:MAG: hypothetical protein HY704_10250 [Gemmatimonadetes bacterium]|nr:hypothetical protein [Gemmatimonadota bacterium]